MCLCLISLGMTISLKVGTKKKVGTSLAILSAGTPHYYKGSQLM